MSSIGKIFTIVNLLLAGLFLGWAIAALNTANQWKADHAKVKAEMTAMQTSKDAKIAELDTKFATEHDAFTRAAADRDASKAEAESLKTEIASVRREKEAQASTLQSLDANVKSYNEKLASLEASKDRAQAEAKEALTKLADVRETLQTRELELGAKNDALAKATADGEEMSAKLVAATKQADKNKTLLQQVVAMTGISLADITAQPQIDAAVLAVKADVQPGLVMLNVGKDKQVSAGMTFHVYSGSTYKGSVRVENVQQTMCSAVVTTAVSGTSMSQGDNASTRL
jgi:predicted RNase H-like nuclease (RuvC/YqgF family)